MRISRGFTLVELVVAIAVLSVLGAYAVTRFAALEREATLVALQNMGGVMNAASSLVTAKAIASGQTSGRNFIRLDGSRTVETRDGYAVANWNRAVRYMINEDSNGFARNLNAPCDRDWCGRGFQRSLRIDSGTLTTPGRVAKVWPRGYTYNTLCGVYYVNDENGTKPRVGVISSGC